ncbi:hypothetical protein V1512DRAFT_268166 [Lipomyces arxii]|uniref:uncharacterized protein n=1 Tax=Lipomyces arxii TaxID=56418 RepID=UPI0034CEBE99
MPSISNECSLRRSNARSLTPLWNELPTPPQSTVFIQQNRDYSTRNDLNYIEGCSYYISSLFYPNCSVSITKIKQMIKIGNLSIGTVAASCCILRTFYKKFYESMKSITNENIGELILISSFMLAYKYMEDEVWKLSTWASLCAFEFSCSELRQTELHILESIDFNIGAILTSSSIQDVKSEIIARQSYNDFFNQDCYYYKEQSFKHGLKRNLSTFLNSVSNQD